MLSQFSGKVSGSWVLTAAYVEDEACEVAIPLQRFNDRISNRRKLVSTKARRDEDDARVLGIRRDGFVSQLDEVDDVRSHDRPPFARRVGELRAVVQLGIAGFV